jgi:hypothetical protein
LADLAADQVAVFSQALQGFLVDIFIIPDEVVALGEADLFLLVYCLSEPIEPHFDGLLTGTEPFQECCEFLLVLPRLPFQILEHGLQIVSGLQYPLLNFRDRPFEGLHIMILVWAMDYTLGTDALTLAGEAEVEDFVLGVLGTGVADRVGLGVRANQLWEVVQASVVLAVRGAGRGVCPSLVRGLRLWLPIRLFRRGKGRWSHTGGLELGDRGNLHRQVLVELPHCTGIKCSFCGAYFAGDCLR